MQTPYLTRARELLARPRGQKVGIVDTAVAAVAERLGIERVLTLDRRHFRQMRTKKGRPFRLVPEPG